MSQAHCCWCHHGSSEPTNEARSWQSHSAENTEIQRLQAENTRLAAEAVRLSREAARLADQISRQETVAVKNEGELEKLRSENSLLTKFLECRMSEASGKENTAGGLYAGWELPDVRLDANRIVQGMDEGALRKLETALKEIVATVCISNIGWFQIGETIQFQLEMAGVKIEHTDKYRGVAWRLCENIESSDRTRINAAAKATRAAAGDIWYGATMARLVEELMAIRGFVW